MHSTLKKKVIVIKSNGQCKQAPVMNTLSKKALLGCIENALQVSEKMWREPIESNAKVVKERYAKLSLSGLVCVLADRSCGG